MVIGYHVIFSTHGFWLPNNPRGSWSDFVGQWELLRYGRATKTDVRHSVARASHDIARRLAAKTVLKHPEVFLTGIQARAVGCGFSRYIEKSGISMWACSILPQHVHIVIARHSFDIEYVINQLKGYATRHLRTEKIHPQSDCWGRGLWKVFLNTPEDVARAVRYVEQNPVKDGLPQQHWSFVKLFSRDPQGSAHV